MQIGREERKAEGASVNFGVSGNDLLDKEDSTETLKGGGVWEGVLGFSKPSRSRMVESQGMQ